MKPLVFSFVRVQTSPPYVDPYFLHLAVFACHVIHSFLLFCLIVLFCFAVVLIACLLFLCVFLIAMLWSLYIHVYTALDWTQTMHSLLQSKLLFLVLCLATIWSGYLEVYRSQWQHKRWGRRLDISAWF